MNTIKFEKSYITKCFKAFSFYKGFNNLLKYLENGDYNNVRIHMDYSIDSLQEDINTVIDVNEVNVHNARVTKLKDMYNCWEELFVIIDNELDGTRSELLEQTRSE